MASLQSKLASGHNSNNSSNNGQEANSKRLLNSELARKMRALASPSPNSSSNNNSSHDDNNNKNDGEGDNICLLNGFSRASDGNATDGGGANANEDETQTSLDALLAPLSSVFACQSPTSIDAPSPLTTASTTPAIPAPHPPSSMNYQVVAQRRESASSGGSRRQHYPLLNSLLGSAAKMKHSQPKQKGKSSSGGDANEEGRKQKTPIEKTTALPTSFSSPSLNDVSSNTTPYGGRTSSRRSTSPSHLKLEQRDPSGESSSANDASLTTKRQQHKQPNRDSSYDVNYEYSQEGAYDNFGVERRLVVVNKNGDRRRSKGGDGQDVQQQQQQQLRETVGMGVEKVERAEVEQPWEMPKNHHVEGGRGSKDKKKRQQQRQQRQSTRARTSTFPGPTSTNLSVPWVLSPFQKHKSKSSPRGSSINALDSSSRKKEEGMEKKKKTGLNIPTRVGHQHQQHQQTRTASPVDLDEISVGSSSNSTAYKNDEDDTEGGYYSAPTEADLRQRSGNIGNGTVVRSLGSTGQNVLATNSRKCLDSERVLSQLGMDVREEDYCIEGEFGSRYDQRAGPKLNYHVHHKGQNGVTRTSDGTKQNKQQSRRRSSKDIASSKTKQRSGGNFKESMKKINTKARQTIGSIINKSDGDDSLDDALPSTDAIGSAAASPKRQQQQQQQQHRYPPSINNDANHPSTKVFPKVFSLLRGQHHSQKPAAAPVPQQIITITPSNSEDNDVAISQEEFHLIKRWQNARARREGYAFDYNDSVDDECDTLGADVDSEVAVNSADRKMMGNEDVMSITASSYSDSTAVMDNRRRPRHKTDYSF